jgi:3-isopropylmalate/(R)-2-methylmalate dehydratase small subunit
VIIEGTAVVIEVDNVNTDVLYPGPYLNIDDPEVMKLYLFEGLDPSLRDKLGGKTILVVGDNFGGGSSREHVQLAMKAWGVGAVVGRSFARIFFRNCINLGLPAIACSGAVAVAADGSRIRIDPGQGRVEVDGCSFDTPVLPRFVIDMIQGGGLVEYVRGRLAERAAGEE